MRKGASRPPIERDWSAAQNAPAPQSAEALFDLLDDGRVEQVPGRFRVLRYVVRRHRIPPTIRAVQKAVELVNQCASFVKRYSLQPCPPPHVLSFSSEKPRAR